MKVMKFGGTSVGKPERMQQVIKLITKDDENKIVVLSALSGTTGILTEISEALKNNDRRHAKNKIDSLQKFYMQFTEQLHKTETGKLIASEIIEEHAAFFDVVLKINYSDALNNDILAQGELTGCNIFCAYLKEAGIDHVLLPALDFIQTDYNDEPLIGNIKIKLTQLINKHKGEKLFVTQGNICRNRKGEVDNLKRGGSDYTASIIAAALNASVCEIWTDIDALHNNDKESVSATAPVEKMSFEEAAELAYFGPKILHPASLWPARHYSIPVKLLNTMNPDDKGTSIVNESGSLGVKAVAAKDNITAIKIKSSRMLLAHGFLRKIFKIFEHHETSIDMVTTSEVAVSVTIDDRKKLDDIVEELENLGVVGVDENQTIITIVGNQITETPKVISRIFESISDIPIRMMSYGGSRHNISVLIDTKYKAKALQALHNELLSS